MLKPYFENFLGVKPHNYGTVERITWHSLYRLTNCPHSDGEKTRR